MKPSCSVSQATVEAAILRVSAECRTGGVELCNTAVTRESLHQLLVFGFEEKALTQLVEDSKNQPVSEMSVHDLHPKNADEAIGTVETMQDGTHFYVMGKDSWSYFQKVSPECYLLVKEWRKERLLQEAKDLFLPIGARDEVARQVGERVTPGFHRVFDAAVKELVSIH